MDANLKIWFQKIKKNNEVEYKSLIYHFFFNVYLQVSMLNNKKIITM